MNGDSIQKSPMESIPEIKEEQAPEPFEPSDSIIQDPMTMFNPSSSQYLTSFTSHLNPMQVHVADIAVYENVRVHFPVARNSRVYSYAVYTVKYTHKGREFEARRRYSDFRALRGALRKYAPCHYIYPAHRKRKTVS